MGTGEIAEGAVQAPAVRWLFAGYMLDESTLELSRDGRLLPIERKPLEVLLFMLQHSGEVVTKDELLAAVWPGRILSDTALAKCISRLRDVLADQNQSLIKTAHGYGYRFAGSPRTELIAREAPPLLAELKAGDHPPLRPLWTLQERIGGGGGGDTWKVRHDKTGEIRVFKFARDPARLVGLKREITLYRLIKNTLEDEAPIVTLLDWNLAEPPYFIESRLADGGSLADWWKAVGGAAAVPMEERIELIARIADGLAAIHSIGVLHKDLKPSNVLLELETDQTLRVMLGDLGSGGLSDPARMDSIGITRMGFTRTLIQSSGGSGTPMYLAPEVLMGQPPTIQADLYALGIVLFQLVSGDLSRPLASGWERDIDDELIKDDIARAADGNPGARFGDAAEFARGLRNLAERRLHRDMERAAAAKTAQALHALERAKARRAGMLLAITALIVGLTVSSALYFDARRARITAETETQRAIAISNFLSNDVFATIDVRERPVKDITVKDLLDQAAAKVDQRLTGSPAEAAAILSSLAGGYDSLSQVDEAERLYEQAIQRYDEAIGVAGEPQLEISAKLIILKYGLGHLIASLPQIEATAAKGARRLGSNAPAVINLRMGIGRGQALLARWQQAEKTLTQLDHDLHAEGAAVQPEIANTLDSLLGYVELNVGQYRDAEQRLRRALDYSVKTRGDQQLKTAMARLQLAEVLIAVGKYDEADRQLSTAVDIAGKWLETGAGNDVAIRQTMGFLRYEQGRPTEALSVLQHVFFSAKGLATGGTDQLVPLRYYIALCLESLGRYAEAEATMREAIAIGARDFGLNHVDTTSARVGLAGILVELGRYDEAKATLIEPEAVAYPQLPLSHPRNLELMRVRGLLEIGRADFVKGCSDLRIALEGTSALLGGDHWRTRRIREEMADERSAHPTAAVFPNCVDTKR